MSRFLVSSTNNNKSTTTTDDEEHRINLLFPKCKVRVSPQQEPKSSPGQTEPATSTRHKCPGSTNFPNSLLLECSSDSNANREKKLYPARQNSEGRESTGEVNIPSSGQSFELLYIDNSQSASRSVAEFLGGVQTPGRGRSQRVENVRGVLKRKEGGYHYNISNQRRRTHNHNSCRSPCGIDLRRQELKSNPRSPLVHQSQFQKTSKAHINSSINNQETTDGAVLLKKLVKATPPPPQFQSKSPGEKMDFDNSAVDEDSGHFENGTGSGSNGSTFSENNTPLSGGGGSGGGGGGPSRPGPLHDSRIEIAGGREIFSQNKTRVGRRGRGVVGGPSTLDYESHFLHSPSSATKGRRKVIPPGTAANITPRYAGSTKKSAPTLGNSHQGTSTSTVWELQLERKMELPNTQFVAGAPPRIRNSYRHYGSYKQKHKSGNGYGQMRPRQHSFPSTDYYSPPNPSSFHNFPRDPSHHPPPRVHGTIKETMFGTEITSVEKSVVYDEMGRVVSCDQRLRTLDPTPLPEKSSVVYGAYAPNPADILFDDIEDWREVGGMEGDGSGGYGLKSGNTSSNLSSSPQYPLWEGRMGGGDNDDKRKLTYTQIMDSSSLCPSIQVEGNTSPSGYESDECSVSAPASHPNFYNENKRLIGNLPIAEYEGSPRRYGLYRKPPGAVSMPNDLDLVDLCSGIQVPFPSTHSLEATTTGNRTLETQDMPNSTLLTKNPTKAQQSPNGGTRMPGFPQRILTTCPKAHQSSSNCAAVVGMKPQPIPVQGNGEVEFAQVHGIENCKMPGKLSGRAPGSGAQDRGIPSSALPREVPVLSHEVALGATCRGSGGTCDGGSEIPGASGGGGAEPRSVALSREQYDYLYEFSETRKVLEEFFHSSDTTCPRGGVSPSDFDELDYTLRRQNGNSYVGQRLAGGELCLEGGGGVEESPKIPHRRGGREVVMSLGIPSELGEGSEFGTSPRLITLHDVSRHSSSLVSPASKNSPADEGNRDVNDNDLDVETTSTNTETDLGETEIGHQVRHPRNYALSPESTDCDSHELESEMSLDYEVSVHSSSRIGTTMPVLEDGLSSGNASENDEEPIDFKHGTGEADGGGGHESSSSVNPTLLLMKKQITEIEKEIQMRATTTGTNQQAASNGGGDGMSMSGGGYFPGELEVLPSASFGESCQTDESSAPNESTSANANIKVHEVPLCDRRSNSSSLFDCNDPELEALDPMRPTPPPSPAPASASISHHPESHNLSSSTTPALRLPATSSITHAISPGKVSSSMSRVDGTTPANGLHLSTPGDGPRGGETKESISTYHTSLAEPLKLISSIMTPPDSTKEPPFHRAKQYQLPKFDASSFTSLLPKPSSLSMTTGPVCVNQDDSPQSELHESSSEERLGPHGNSMSPVWVPRRSLLRGDRNHHGGFAGLREPFRKRYEEIPDDDADTDQETDRLLGQHRTEDDYGFYNEKDWKKTKLRGILASSTSVAPAPPPPSAKGVSSSTSSFIKPTSHVPGSLPSSAGNNHSSSAVVPRVIPPTSSQELPKHLSLNSPTAESSFPELPLSLPPSKPQKEKEGAKKKRNKEDFMKNPSVLIEGVLFRARYLGSTQLISEGQPTKATRMLQAEEAVSRIKAQANQNPPSGLSDSTASLLSSSSSSITLPLVPSTSSSTTTDDEPTSPPRFHSATTAPDTEDRYPCGSESTEAYDHLSVGGPGPKDKCVIRRTTPKPRCDIGDLDDAMEEDESNFIVDNDDAFEFDPNLRRSPSDSCKSQNNSSSSDGSGSGRSRLRIRRPPPSSRHKSSANCTSMSPFHNCQPACGSAVTGTMFHLRFIGSLEVEEEVGTGVNRRKRAKKGMVEEAVVELKAPDGETQPSTEVDLFISTEKIMVLNTDLKEIMMDHALRTISYIADIGDLVVLMARRRPVPTDPPEELSKIHRPPKMICHVFESDEAQYIAQSIGQAFQVAYMEFLKANGIEDHSFVREMDYQEVLNSQEIFGDELQMFAKKELQKDVVVPKAKGEILGVVIVESGWGSMLPTVVIANLAPAGAAARCGQLNIGDQIIAINGVSLVGLPLSTCQTYIKNSKTQTVVKLTVVPCPPVVEVKIKRPDTKYQLGFSVQNGVICSLLRGGIAERGGVRVGHRIIEINNQSVVAVPHEKIVNLLATSVGEINMKTMPTSMFRLLTGQETPLYI